MREPNAFVRQEMAFRRAAAEGAREAAEVLAGALRTEGHRATVSTSLDGAASVSLEGASAIAREFGTRTQEARPVMGPMLIQRRARMTEAMANAISRSFKETPR